LLPGSHECGPTQLPHTFVGSAHLLYSPYIPASAAWLAVSFLSDLCPTAFPTDTEKSQEGRSLVIFQDTSQALQVPPPLAPLSPFALFSLIPYAVAVCAAEERAHAAPQWHRAAASDIKCWSDQVSKCMSRTLFRGA